MRGTGAQSCNRVYATGLGNVQAQNHDYKRHETTTLFVALNLLSGHVPGTSCHDAAIRNSCLFWSEMLVCAHPRYRRHFTPTGVSWLNLAERFLVGITNKRTFRGTFPNDGE